MPGVGLGEFGHLKRINRNLCVLTVGLRNLVQNFPRFSGFSSGTQCYCPEHWRGTRWVGPRVEIMRVLCALAILFSIVCERWALLHLN